MVFWDIRFGVDFWNEFFNFWIEELREVGLWWLFGFFCSSVIDLVDVSYWVCGVLGEGDDVEGVVV